MSSIRWRADVTAAVATYGARARKLAERYAGAGPVRFTVKPRDIGPDPGPLPTLPDGRPLSEGHPQMRAWRAWHEQRAAIDAAVKAIAAVKPHRDPKPRKPESIEAYAERMARFHKLHPVGTLPCTCERPKKLCVCHAVARDADGEVLHPAALAYNERLPDASDELDLDAQLDAALGAVA